MVIFLHAWGFQFEVETKDVTVQVGSERRVSLSESASPNLPTLARVKNFILNNLGISVPLSVHAVFVVQDVLLHRMTAWA
jgi:hypothetical protein